MKLVSKWEDVEKNLSILEQYRNSSQEDERNFYLKIIERGICFVVSNLDGQLVFGPSRFIGYLNNSREAHLANEQKDGRETNPRISKILGGLPEQDDTLEEEYKKFCEGLGITPKDTGPFRIKRKYWDNRRLN